MSFDIPNKSLPGRYGLIAVALPVFMAVNLLTRVGLMVLEGEGIHLSVVLVLKILGVGAVYDLFVFAFILIPFVLLALIMGNGLKQRKLHALLAQVLLATATFAFIFIAIAEVQFWREFGSRFNFIAVDYLVYTREVLGNIIESFPVGPIMAGVVVLTVIVIMLLGATIRRVAGADAGRFRKRLAIAAVLLCLPWASLLLANDRLKAGFTQPAAREIAANGYYEFVRAMIYNDLDYFGFYKVLKQDKADAIVQQELHDGEPGIRFNNEQVPVAHFVQPGGPPLAKHLVLVSIESLGSDYVGAFGGRTGLTPNLDELAGQGMMFTNLYATGLRTVRGLEAISLSLPPTPGRAVPVRRNNVGLQSLGGVLKSSGYKPFYIYGGYSYFDNMENFFSGNGYTVVDRIDVPDAEIHHETIWGICDEDILHHAVEVIGATAMAGQKVFAHIMTTSNHRPYTFPDGRVDMPSGSGRDAAVEYTDWAIGNFMREARTQPWFDDTVFVFVADHTSHGRGRTDLPPENYRIPMIIYAPGFLAPGRFAEVVSQIDIAPTLLGLLNVAYESEFFGQDIFRSAARHQRAFLANYLTIGYLEGGKVVELMPRRISRVVDAGSGSELDETPQNSALVDDAVAYYQTASVQLRRLHR